MTTAPGPTASPAQTQSERGVDPSPTNTYGTPANNAAAGVGIVLAIVIAVVVALVLAQLGKYRGRRAPQPAPADRPFRDPQ